MNIDLPGEGIAEITLIGTGGGYGESCVVHLGNQEWIVIDSCINPNSRTSLPLEYLQKIGVNVENDVKLVICTHWHDDHIQGIAQLLDVAQNAKFCCAMVNDIPKFLRLVELDYKKYENQPSVSSTFEFNACLEILETRNKSLAGAYQDRNLYTVQLGNTQSRVISLSPSDATIKSFDLEISQLMAEYADPNKKIQVNKPNAKSVAVFLQLGQHRALLGADLENSANADEGWLNIINNSQSIDKKASLYKISHHGSETGYEPRIFVDLLSHNPVSKLTPYNKKNKLPDPNMLKIYCDHSDRVFMTSRVINTKPKKRNKSIEKIIKELSIGLSEVKYEQGIIRCRIEINDINANWDVTCHEGAFHVNPML